MKKFIIIAMLTAIMPLAAMAQHEEDTENGVVSLAGREGFTIETKKGDFVFKPYLLVQTSANFNWYDDEGLDKAYNQDNIANSGFSVPYAVLGFTGKAFDKISFNLSINAAASGGALLQQAYPNSVSLFTFKFGLTCLACSPVIGRVSIKLSLIVLFGLFLFMVFSMLLFL